MRFIRLPWRVHRSHPTWVPPLVFERKAFLNRKKNPYFLHGTKTYVYEMWEERGGTLPEAVVVPVGNGTLLLGASLAIEELYAHGLIAERPAVKRGRMVNRVIGDPASQLHERHDAADFDTKTQDKLAPAG